MAYEGSMRAASISVYIFKNPFALFKDSILLMEKRGFSIDTHLRLN